MTVARLVGLAAVLFGLSGLLKAIVPPLSFVLFCGFMGISTLLILAGLIYLLERFVYWLFP